MEENKYVIQIQNCNTNMLLFEQSLSLNLKLPSQDNGRISPEVGIH